jgi:hypothetical protein
MNASSSTCLPFPVVCCPAPGQPGFFRILPRPIVSPRPHPKKGLAVACSFLHDSKKHCHHRSVLDRYSTASAATTAGNIRADFAVSGLLYPLVPGFSWRCGATANSQSQHTFLADPAAYEIVKKSTIRWISLLSHGRWISCGPTDAFRDCRKWASDL